MKAPILLSWQIIEFDPIKAFLKISTFGPIIEFSNIIEFLPSLTFDFIIALELLRENYQF